MKKINFFVVAIALLLTEFVIIPDLLTDQGEIDCLRILISFPATLLIAWQMAQSSPFENFERFHLHEKLDYFFKHLFLIFGTSFAILVLASIKYNLSWGILNSVLLIGSSICVVMISIIDGLYTQMTRLGMAGSDISKMEWITIFLEQPLVLLKIKEKGI